MEIDLKTKEIYDKVDLHMDGLKDLGLCGMAVLQHKETRTGMVCVPGLDFDKPDDIDKLALMLYMSSGVAPSRTHLGSIILNTAAQFCAESEDIFFNFVKDVIGKKELVNKHGKLMDRLNITAEWIKSKEK